MHKLTVIALIQFLLGNGDMKNMGSLESVHIIAIALVIGKDDTIVFLYFSN